MWAATEWGRLGPPTRRLGVSLKLNFKPGPLTAKRQARAARWASLPGSPSLAVRACHGGIHTTPWPDLPWDPTVPVTVGPLPFHGGLSETPPQPRAVFLMGCIVSGGALQILLVFKLRHFHHLGHISFQFTAQPPFSVDIE